MRAHSPEKPTARSKPSHGHFKVMLAMNRSAVLIASRHIRTAHTPFDITSDNRDGASRTVRQIESAQRSWCMVNAPHLVALVRADATLVNGKLAERPGEDDSPAA